MFKKNKQTLSIPTTTKVCGVEIRKMPLGAYVEALQKINDFPENFISECFPGKSFQEIINEFSHIDESGVASLFTSLLTVAPKYIISFVADLVGVDEAILLNDPEIGALGAVKIVRAFIEVNSLGECASDLKELVATIKALVK